MISLIAVVGKNNELGKNNSLIWHLPNDLKFFKEVTSGHVVVMGRNTFKSLPKVLPNRTNVVLTTSLETVPEGVIIFKNINDVMNKYKDFFVIGGASIYKQFIEYADNIYLTEVDKKADADTFFPSFDKTKYTKELIRDNSDDDIKYRHVLYRRKNER